MSLESKCTPRNLKVVTEGIGEAERKKVGVVTILSLEKARAAHLPTENERRHRAAQAAISFRYG